ncbi:Xenotropic and polytropic retrovirus receptor 1 [Exophiala dermatitidis]|nr:Xenotropic and polytropic retrovirus receptor 1 [Exophiala dermatitidis]
MKFAKELEDEAVPEWRVKYLDYKAGTRQGKKKIKAIARALRALNRTPGAPARPALLPEDSSDRIPFTHYDFYRPRPTTGRTAQSLPADGEGLSREGPEDQLQRPDTAQSRTLFAHSPPILVPSRRGASYASTPERRPLHEDGQYGPGQTQMNYGSIIGSLPQEETPGQFTALELPDPALSPARTRTKGDGEIPPSHENLPLPEAAQVPPAPDPYHVGETRPRHKHHVGASLSKSMFKNRQDTKNQSMVDTKPSPNPRSRLKRFFSAYPLDQPNVNDVQLEAYRDLDAKQAEFFAFLDRELDKIENFYKMKEEEATERLQVLRRQLHEMRDRRLAEILNSRKPKETNQLLVDNSVPGADLIRVPSKDNALPVENGTNGTGITKKPIIPDALGRRGTIGKTTQAMQQLSSPPGPKAQKRINDAKRDYVQHKRPNDVPYRFAKRRLKLALQEYYRGLELLKSYALLNRTAFRKINKKYDKLVQARPPLRYMSEKVNDAYFVQSDVVDNLLMAVEDLYARYFERGNHKIAVRKLRSKLGPGDQSGTTFRNGLYVAAGVCFGISGLVQGTKRLFDSSPPVSTNISYLLQLYAGYFLALLLFLLFCLDCRIWTKAHINYVFIFEFDTRHVLDWRQLAELPCFFLFLNGLFLYINFQADTSDWLFLYSPVLLIVITLIIMALPFKALYYNARRWWGYSNWRLLLAGLYPVEFRDFYLGDMYCSETYAMGQIEVFFCLYVNDWNNPAQCNSNHSRLLGFFTALPAVWRAFQCLRRYYDTRNWFPHLANFVKYLGNISYYMTLSLYRIHMTDEMRAVFITFAAINGVYSSFWDVCMDFSLGNPWAKHPFLRDQLAYKKASFYYFAIVADVVLRQQWILYAIFTRDLQHSALLSFFVSLAEVLRRGMWSLFRVENEHCNNVGKFRASRDIPLPYEIPESPEMASKTASPAQQRLQQQQQEQQQPSTTAPGEEPIAQHEDYEHQPQHATGVDVERYPTATTAASSPSLRHRKWPSGGPPTPRTPGMRALQRVGTVIASAHAQDFEKRRRPEVEGPDGPDGPDGRSYQAGSSDEDEDYDDDDDDDEEGDGDEVAELRRQQQQEQQEFHGPHVG